MVYKKITKIMNKKELKIDINKAEHYKKNLFNTAINSFNEESILIKGKNLDINQPNIFKKNISNIKTIRHINNDTGKVKHFTPASQE
jgi:hypothetical protein